MSTKTKTKTPPGMAQRRHDWDNSDHNERPQDAHTIASAMRDYAARWRACGTRVPGDVLLGWAEWVEGREPMRPPTRDERIEEIRVEAQAARKAKRAYFSGFGKRKGAR